SDVGVYHPGIAMPNGPIHNRQGRGASPLWPEAMTAGTKHSLKDRFEYLAKRLMHDPIPDGGNAQGPFAASALGDFDPSHRLGAIGLAAQVLREVKEPSVGLAGELFDRHPVDPCRALVGRNDFPGRLEIGEGKDFVI